MLHVSVSTVRRRLRYYSLSYRLRRTRINNMQLDAVVRTICSFNRHLGYRLVHARLVSENIYVSRQRVRDSMLRVNPTSVALRWCHSIRRRSYRVAGPNSLWHIDGNHKLIRWGFVIHGGIDGYSRLMVFLSIACNNRAATVLRSFRTATSTYGIPSRVRADRGTENNEVETYMNVNRGMNRGSMIRGRSVHNQRIERFWRDLFHGSTNVYYDLFYFMEDSGILDINNNIHRWSLQYVFTPRMQRNITIFQNQWNNHRLSSERGHTPCQLYIEGILRLLGSGHSHIDNMFYDPGSNDHLEPNDLPDYGID
ncbi:uncharacterized protein LOC135493847 [Lineus longissimus]|uniref:uncharacterized protein LOC135493847 n=1 Tax=Lineus longissimus TaxID=88925 RepID=UPI00315D26BC